MNVAIYTFTLTIDLLFFAICGILGINFEGSESSSFYKILVGSFGAYSILSISFIELKNYSDKKRGSFIPYFFPLIISLCYYFHTLNTDLNINASSNIFQLFIAFCCPSIFIANYCFRYNRLNLVAKNLDLVMIIISLSLIISLPSLLTTGIMSFGGNSYQALSYTSAFAFGINLCSLIGQSKYNKYKILNSRVFKFISLFFLAIQCLSVSLSGGRGGAILLIILTLWVLYLFHKKNFSKSIYLIIFILLIGIIIINNLSSLGVTEQLNKGLSRTFSYITSSGIDISKTSNRDNLYNLSLNLIKEQFPLGYGIFNQYDYLFIKHKYSYSHNYFLELLLQGGVIFLVIGSIVYFSTINKLRKILNKNKGYLILLPITLYPFIMLLFSGTYLTSQLFWFSTIFILQFNMSKLK